MSEPVFGKKLSFDDRIKRNFKSGRVTAGMAFVLFLIVVGIGGFSIYAAHLYTIGYFNSAPAAQPGQAGTTIAVQNSALSGVLGFYWQNVPGNTGTPAAVVDTANPSPFTSSSSPFITGSITVGSSNQVTVGSSFNSFPYYSMVSCTACYPSAQEITGVGSTTIPGFPSFSNQVQTIACPSTTCNSGSYIQTVPTIPYSYANATTSVTGVTLKCVNSWSGTTLPSSGSITCYLAGVSARGGGVGADQGAAGQILAGIPNEPVTQYTSVGTSAVASPGTLVPTTTSVVLEENQSGFTVGQPWSAINTRGQPSGSFAYLDSSILACTSTTSSNACGPQYDFATFTIPFQYTGTTGKDITFNIELIDNQSPFEIQTNFLDNSGITGAAVACTSSATTNMCTNSTDITVGTAQNLAGTAVSWGGGGSGSATKPGWFMQSITVNNGGWATYAPLMTTQTVSVVYGT